MFVLDHIAVIATNLDDGVAHVADALGVTAAGGGEHPMTATHNRLLGLGDIYLEIIAINPAAGLPKLARWDVLQRLNGPPRLANWIVRSDDLDRDFADSPDGMGEIVSLQRGDLRWRMSKSTDGKQPFDNAYPAMLQWQGKSASDLIPDSGCRFISLEITHPDAGQLNQALSANLADERVSIIQGDSITFKAEIQTPNGLCQLI